MTVARTALRVITTWSAAVAISSGVNLPCSTGTRVYALTVWSEDWVHGMFMRCTGGSEEHALPPQFSEFPFGNETEDVCAGAGGVKSIEWGKPEIYDIMVYLNITCLDNEVYHFANSTPYDYWNITSNHTDSCGEGQYVQGTTYSSTFYDDNRTNPYSFFDLGFMCSSSPLDPICTDCSGDTTLKADDDLPEFCVLPICTQAECCKSTESKGIFVDVLVGLGYTVAATAIGWFSKRTYARYKKRMISNKRDRKNEGSKSDEPNVRPEIQRDQVQQATIVEGKGAE